MYKAITLGYKFGEVPVTKIYPAKKLGYTKMQPLICPTPPLFEQLRVQVNIKRLREKPQYGAFREAVRLKLI